MQVNYFIIGIVVLIAMGIIILLVLRNRKDEKDFEKDSIEDAELVKRQDPDKD
ncbi:hypothetical protein ACFQZX_16410 [Mucilaginibacter litoreus]|uniref:LPXTG-motif cell wall anchor domain-containing protein n=1 Tax=Mucilaginibacter litoreus TaxID=1048221 RepID=A0ABW3AWE5_9SPHI